MEALKKLEMKYRILENSAKECEQRLKLILSNVPDIIYMLNPEGQITYISDSIEQYGYSPDELIGTDIMDIIDPQDKPKAVYRIKERRTGTRKTKAYNIRMLAKNKTAIPFEVKTANIETPLLVTVTAEGYYSVVENNFRKFMGTVGVAREIERKNHKNHSVNDTSDQKETFIPICSNCKRIRDNQGNWKKVEDYFGKMLDIHFTHGICADCISDLYPDMETKKKKG
ncbi:PAS domain-containing protein [bacterium]|nr:PAS domain-containing protein [bacterium]